jgi:methylenetetrahydrofolate--tRNA-(uracil-5-)-methyltransferase
MNVNFGLFPPLTEPVRAEDGRRLKGPEKSVYRKKALTSRAAQHLEDWLAGA